MAAATPAMSPPQPPAPTRRPATEPTVELRYDGDIARAGDDPLALTTHRLAWAAAICVAGLAAGGWLWRAPDASLRGSALLMLALLALCALLSIGALLAVAALRQTGRRMGAYHLIGVIEEGGMATVHRAEHALLKRPTAIKVLKRHLANDELIARFEREVRLASRLEHPATVEIYDYGRTNDGTFYFAMEFIDGLTLAQLVERDGAQPVARVLHIFRQVCESLHEAHAKGLVHRDMKPQNIMLCERGGESDVVKVVDWGLIKDLRADDTRDITQYARMLGTPAYMAPERVRDPARADPRVDIWGLAAVMYYVLTAKRLYDAPNDFDLQRLVLEADAPRLADNAPGPVPPVLDDLVARCLARDPAARPQSVDDLLEVFHALLHDAPWPRTRAEDWWRRYREARAAA
jgi:serine/threonine-protein kinase